MTQSKGQSLGLQSRMTQSKGQSLGL